jgi:succinyl-diaminopimelate desuccinylase
VGDTGVYEDKKQLLQWVEEDHDKLISFLRGFIRAKSPNPPGDTREAAAYVSRFLDNAGLPYKFVAPHEEMPNILASYNCGSPGRRLVLNGHIDVFPVGDGEGWTHDPWGGEIADGKIFGRGACDMKCGTAASIFTFAYLNRIREKLRGSLTLTVVSDEESFGPWGSRYLLEHYTEAIGDCCLNGEPSSPYTLRFGEKGLLWLRLRVHTMGAHGAYTHLSKNAIKIAAHLIAELETLSSIPWRLPEDVQSALEEGHDAAEMALGPGGADVMKKVTVNIGSIHGGLKINMVPRECEAEVDIRLPPGLDSATVIPRIKEIVSRYKEASLHEENYSAPNWSDPQGEMAIYIRENVKMLRGFDPRPIISLGGSDLRLWRSRGVPAYYYGPRAWGMGTVDEYVEVEEFLHVIRTHLLSAYDFLSRS